MAFGTKTLVSFRLSDTTRDNLQELVEVQRKIDEHDKCFSWVVRDRTSMLAMAVDYALGEKRKELAAILAKIGEPAKTIKKLPSNGTRGKKAVANKRINSAPQISSDGSMGAVCRPPTDVEATRLAVEEPLFVRPLGIDGHLMRRANDVITIANHTLNVGDEFEILWKRKWLPTRLEKGVRGPFALIGGKAIVLDGLKARV